MRKHQNVVIRIGGSVFVSETGRYNINLVKQMIQTLLRLSVNYTFFVVTGGGKYIKRIMRVLNKEGVKKEELDRIGVMYTRLNALIFLSLLPPPKPPKIYTCFENFPKKKYPIVVFCGSKPGHTTDWDAVLLARKMRVSGIIKVTDVEGIFDKDPKKYPDAKPFKKIRIERLLGMIKFSEPGVSFPISPTALKLARKYGIKFYVIGRENFAQIKNILKSASFNGTLVF